jgi:hypothetical protein
MHPHLPPQPHSQPPLPPPGFDRPSTRRSWAPAAIIGSAIVLAAGLVAGAVILRGGSDGGGPTTCQAWTQTRQILRAVPGLPQGWNWGTPDIDRLIKAQNAPVGTALDVFAGQIAAEPADVARAAREYVAARRTQMESLADRTYVPADGAAVDAALGRLNRLCGIPESGQSI